MTRKLKSNYESEFDSKSLLNFKRKEELEGSLTLGTDFESCYAPQVDRDQKIPSRILDYFLSVSLRKGERKVSKERKKKNPKVCEDKK